VHRCLEMAAAQGRPGGGALSATGQLVAGVLSETEQVCSAATELAVRMAAEVDRLGSVLGGTAQDITLGRQYGQTAVDRLQEAGTAAQESADALRSFLLRRI
jgi:hypothetical protein